MRLEGLHHVTAVTADAPGNHAFYTGVLGMRMVKKTVNQDDTSAYHLFYADGLATPGSDLTFFDWPVQRERRGTNAPTRTGLRVAGEAALAWWGTRLSEHGITHAGITARDGRAVLDFEDPEGQRLSLVDDGGEGPAYPWDRSTVPVDHQIRGLGPVELSVADPRATALVLTQVMGMERLRDYAAADGAAVEVFGMGDGGAGAEVHLAGRTGLPAARQGAGAVHHVAFRTKTMESYHAWTAHLAKLGIRSSGEVDRFWFRSLYFREPNGILFEIATDEPGFTADEPLETLGETLSLPPFLESRRAQIEAGLKPLRTA